MAQRELALSNRFAGRLRFRFGFALLILCLTLASHNVLADITLRDGEFRQGDQAAADANTAPTCTPVDWVTVGPQVSLDVTQPPVVDPGGITFIQMPEGGNPGAYGQATHTLATIDNDRGVVSWIALINRELCFEPGDFVERDPGAPGGLTLDEERIAFSVQFDARLVGRGARAITFGLQQTIDGVTHTWTEVDRRIIFRDRKA